MPATLVIQSHRTPLPYAWLEPCLTSVKQWSKTNSFDYQFLDDDLFSSIAPSIRDKFQLQRVVLSDLGRLHVLHKALRQGYERVVWLDTDFLIFHPDQFILPDSGCALGREVWVQQDQHGKLKAYKKVHNAFLTFTKQSALLAFYIETAERLLMEARTSVPPQFIGPKLLTAIHNISHIPVMESAGMLSPMTIQDVLSGGGSAYDLFKKKSPELLAGANLCTSSCDREELSSDQMEKLIEILLSNGLP